MAHTKIYERNREAILKPGYQHISWDKFDYDILKYINIVKRSNKNADEYNDCFIMLDTETSKKYKQSDPQPCHVVAFTISIRAYHENIVTLYGHDPVECLNAIENILKYMPAKNTIMYIFNMSYDWVFLRQFFFSKFGLPDKQLNTKPYFPIMIKWENGLQLRDALILAQRKLEKWAEDLCVEHQKAVGKWDYDKIRHQKGHRFTKSELDYIECDTLAGVECLDALCTNLNYRVCSMPFTATGIVRNEIRNRGRKNRARQTFNKCANDWQIQMVLEMVFHGGYAHANRGLATWLSEFALCKDFCSSYPTSALIGKVPMSSFKQYTGDDIDENDIVEMSDTYAFVFRMTAFNVHLKDPFFPMPMLQDSKLITAQGKVLDNGRVMDADAVQIWFTDYDLKLFLDMYTFDNIIISDVIYAHKDYLPRWLTDYIYELFVAKSQLKGKDEVNYNIRKAALNSVYGCMVQKPVSLDIKENYMTGEYTTDKTQNKENLYNKYLNNKNKTLCYSWGVYITSESMYRLYQLSKCIKKPNTGWLYSDTDSIYSNDWDEDKVEAFNAEMKQRLLDRGYGPVHVTDDDGTDHEYWLGIADNDKCYEKFVAIGAKRYAGIDAKSKELKITVAGVPKKGAACLKDLSQFRPGFRFSGKKTGKKQHTYFFKNEIYTDEFGNICADSIDLTPCDYTLDSPYAESFDNDGDVFLQVYDEDADYIDFI